MKHKIQHFLWSLTAAGALIGMVVLAVEFPQAETVFQQATLVATALACAVLPYCLARAAAEL